MLSLHSIMHSKWKLLRLFVIDMIFIDSIHVRQYFAMFRQFCGDFMMKKKIHKFYALLNSGILKYLLTWPFKRDSKTTYKYKRKFIMSFTKGRHKLCNKLRSLFLHFYCTCALYTPRSSAVSPPIFYCENTKKAWCVA